jgi:hypothetical protein
MARLSIPVMARSISVMARRSPGHLLPHEVERYPLPARCGNRTMTPGWCVNLDGAWHKPGRSNRIPYAGDWIFISGL